MDFETYILSCVRTQPEDRDWQVQLLHAVVGLVASATQLVTRMREPAGSAESAELLQEEMRSLLLLIERYRALSYYQLDLRPVPRQPRPHSSFSSTQLAAAALPAHAASFAGLVNAWLFERAGFVEGIGRSLEEFDDAREALHALLGIDEVMLWSADRCSGTLPLEGMHSPWRFGAMVSGSSGVRPSRIH